MFFVGPPLITQSAAPVPASVLLMRASYVTQDANDLKQTLAVNDTPETIQFNQIPLASSDLDLDLLTGEVTALKDFNGMASLNVSILRELSGAGNTDWGMFIEVFDSGSGLWVPYEGSLRPITLDSQSTNEKRSVDYSVAVSVLAGQKFRWRHSTNDVSRTVSIVSFAAANGLPASAGAIMSFWGIKP
ncbi:hypothetical protein ACQEXU_10815 [Vibrio sp. TRT 21S02]|uniref:hypothetical protein n=1 Tax=Vibrio sp. TRT 21S02 TaxID=3418507 RepID=UPI003CEF52A0